MTATTTTTTQLVKIEPATHYPTPAAKCADLIVHLAGLACALTWRLARGLWPERPDAAVVATVLLAASS